ncbi:MAG: hypothetical protein IEMM0002_0128 [bacterium]|nr:MAG: hypothetical protein IEMM0002_0128 [bacterium]
MKISYIVFTALFFATTTNNFASAKDILKNAGSLKSENKAYIRADGLACYFCAYGLERFFRKSGKVAAFEMNMKEGIVEIHFIKGRLLLTQAELHKIVYDAGYTPRSTTYELVGQLKKSDGRYFFYINDTNQSFPIKTTAALTAHTEKMIRITTKADKRDGGAMLLEPLKFELLGENAVP